MRNILALIQRFYVFLLFLGLLIFSLIILFSSNNYHRAAFVEHSSDFVGSVYGKRDQLSRYLRLGEINDQLALENAILRSQLPENQLVMDTSVRTIHDSLSTQRYKYRSARVINATITREMNYLTLDRGRVGGIQPDMGVLVDGSVVGFVSSVSNHFSIVTPILHRNFRSAVKVRGYTGQLSWPGGDPAVAMVSDLPKNVPVQVGDTVFTSGFGRFPSNMKVGYVEEVGTSRDIFHELRVRLSTDFRKLNYVQVVDDLMRYELDSLELQQRQKDGAEHSE